MALASPIRSPNTVVVEWPHDEGSRVQPTDGRVPADQAFELIREYFAGHPTPTVTVMANSDDVDQPRDQRQRGRRGPLPAARSEVLKRMREAYDYVAARDPSREPLKHEVAEVAGYTPGSLYRLRRQHDISWPP